MAPWSTSRRRAQLPGNWSSLVAATRDRAAGRCEAATHEPDCTGVGAECDHIAEPLDHSPGNLQWLSRPCHRAKTQREANEARKRVNAARRPCRERHPMEAWTDDG